MVNWYMTMIWSLHCNVTCHSEDNTKWCLYSLLVSMLLQKYVLLYVYVRDIYNGGALWLAIYRILISHSATPDCLLMYTMADVYTYRYDNYLVYYPPPYKQKRNKIIYMQYQPMNICDTISVHLCDVVDSCLYYFVNVIYAAFTVSYCYCPFSSSSWINVMYVLLECFSFVYIVLALSVFTSCLYFCIGVISILFFFCHFVCHFLAISGPFLGISNHFYWDLLI